MLKINKSIEPKFLLEYKKNKSPQIWDDYNDNELKNSIKGFILNEEQNNYCPYCEKIIRRNDEGHIEHIKPRDKFPAYFQNYDNIIVSCNEKLTCGKIKENKYSDDFINPVLDNPEDYLIFNLANGEIIPRCNDDNDIKKKRANYTIETLNLNNYTLKDARKNLIEILEVYTNWFFVSIRL